MNNHFVFYYHLGFAFFLTVIAALITRYMRKHGAILDHPNQRSSHTKITPKSGGISIVVVFILASGFSLVANDTQLILGKPFIVTLLCSILISVISFYDDINDFGIKFKFAWQMIAIVSVLIFGVVIDTLSVPWNDSLQLGVLGYVISFCWIIGLTNACNFMDGIDGLVGGSSLIAALFFTVICYYHQSSLVYILSYSLIAGCIGFLIYNAPPAKIFMGDVGSAFLGFVFATIAILASRYDAVDLPILVMPLLFFHFIYDTAFTFFRRAKKGENPFSAHRSHLYQLLNRSGYSHLEVSLLLACMAFLQGLGAIWMLTLPTTEQFLVFIPFLLIQMVYTRLTFRRIKKHSIEL